MKATFRFLLVALIVAIAMGNYASANENATVDPSQSAVWPAIQKAVFGDRQITFDQNAEFVELFSPASADDASAVPIIVRAKHAQTAKRWTEKIWLIADKNPSPVGGIFQFYPTSGIANIETRIRVEDFTHIRAIIEDNEGKLYMAARWIKASGGCSSAHGNENGEDNLGKIKFKIDDMIEANTPIKAQVMISHPNTSGLAIDQLTQQHPQPKYVKHVDVTYAGKPIMTADVDFSISQNPVFRFYFPPTDKGELKAEILDTSDTKFTKIVRIEPGKPVMDVKDVN